MLKRHPRRQLVAYCDDRLAPGERVDIERHLASCARCRAAVDEIRFAAGLVQRLATASAPDSVWTAVEHRLQAAGESVGLESSARNRGFSRPRWAFAWMAAFVAVVGAAAWYSTQPTAPSWEISRPDEPAIELVKSGEWIHTGPAAGARILVGAIGTVDVEPGSRVRLGAAAPSEYRITLARGAISAQILAPPRIFIVETPAGAVVDLGCAYTLRVDEDGSAVLVMTEGWTALEWNGRESLVPAGAMVRTRPGAGPGLPYFEDASAGLQDAVAAFDAGTRRSGSLGVMLAEARVRDTLTLWHLLARVDAADRARVFDRIAELTPPPATVSRERALQLDPATLTHWREELAWTW